MTWFKTDDDFYDHPKVVRLSMAARGLWLTAGTWCCRHLSEGVILARTVRQLGGTKRQIEALVDAGMWREVVVEGGLKAFEFHDWEVYQPTRAKAEARRERERLKKRAAREAAAARVDSCDDSCAECAQNARDMGCESLAVSRENSTRNEVRIARENEHAISGVSCDNAKMSPGDKVGVSPGDASRARATRPDPYRENSLSSVSGTLGAGARGESSESTPLGDGNRVGGASAPAPGDGFAAWWAAWWGRKSAHLERLARIAYTDALDAGADAGELHDATRRHAQAWQRSGQDPRWIPNPDRWLAEARWRDPVAQSQATPKIPRWTPPPDEGPKASPEVRAAALRQVRAALGWSPGDPKTVSEPPSERRTEQT